MTDSGLLQPTRPTSPNGSTMTRRDILDATAEPFLNTEFGVVGRTASTKNEPNTSSQYHFWVTDRDEARGRIEIGNIVAAYSDEGDDVTFGAVTEMRSYSDVDSFIADYLSHDFGNADLSVPTDVSEVVVVTCAVMRNLSSRTKPVGRCRTYFPSIRGIQYAFGMVDQDGQPIFRGAAIPIGIFENGDGTIAPISVDEDFLVGPEGAQLNVSGISGLAAKTSAVEFCLKSLLTRSAKRIAVVMFNVKSRYLLYVDQFNPRCTEDDWSLRAYELLGIDTRPFEQARFFAPANPRTLDATQSTRRLPTESFSWDLGMIYEDIPTLFSPLDWDDKMEGVWFVIQDEIERGSILSYAQMLQWIDNEINRANQQRPPIQWIRGNHIATWNKMRARLGRFPTSYRGLIRSAGQGSDLPWTELNEGDVFVVDIQALNDAGQRLVFGRAVRAITGLLESGDSSLDAVVLVVDELKNSRRLVASELH